MKKIFFFALALLGSLNVFPQNLWNYDFGNGTARSFVVNDGSFSTTFLPSPTTGGGTAMVRGVNGIGGGNITLTNPSIIAGSGAGLSIIASSSTSVNKFSIYNYTPATVATLKFRMRFSSSSSGTWTFVNGNGGAFEDGSLFSGAEVFAGLRFVMGSSGVAVENRAAASWVPITGSPYLTETTYEVELYLNNSTATSYYTRGSTQNIAPNTYDLWINQTLVGNDLAKAALANNTNMDSFMFYGASSSGNTSVLHLDDISYANYVSPTMLPPFLNGNATNAISADYAKKIEGYSGGNLIGFDWSGSALKLKVDQANSATIPHVQNGLLNFETAVNTGQKFSVNNGTVAMVMLPNGNVGVGTPATVSGVPEKFSVNGNILAKEIKVLPLGWPDYVFSDKYKILSLTEIEKYIRTKGHLPEIPSAVDVEKNGVELGEMNKLLLKKIEELTLLMIQQGKTVEKLEQDVKRLKAKN